MTQEKFIPHFFDYNKSLKTRARNMRNSPTDAERKMWNLLRTGELRNFRFLRQKIIGHYIADFYCSEQKLIIEVDGGGHNESDQQEYDTIRTSFFESLDITVLRFWNSDLIENESGVYEKILATLQP